MKKIFSLLFAINLFATPLTVEEKASVALLLQKSNEKIDVIIQIVEQHSHISLALENDRLNSLSLQLLDKINKIFEVYATEAAVPLPINGNEDSSSDEDDAHEMLPHEIIIQAMSEIYAFMLEIEVIAKINQNKNALNWNEVFQVQKNILDDFIFSIASSNGCDTLEKVDSFIISANFSQAYRKYMKEFLNKTRYCFGNYFRILLQLNAQ